MPNATCSRDTVRELPTISGLGMILASAMIPSAASAQLSLPPDLEVELALSALPEHLRARATVYVLDEAKGFVVASQGTNGFHALVSRIDPAVFRADWPYESHPNDVILPIAFDAAGVNGPMQPFVDAARMQAEGMSAPDLKSVMQKRFLEGYYRPASRAGVAYMLSPVLRAYPDPYGRDLKITANIPHRMFYAPNITNDDIGGDRSASLQPYLIQQGIHGYMIQRSGEGEAREITATYEDMLARLCEYRDFLCVGS